MTKRVSKKTSDTERLPGLKIEILEGPQYHETPTTDTPNSDLAYQPCAEAKIFNTRAATEGKRDHRVICLRPDRLFRFRVFVDTGFKWMDANALKLLIDFDTGSEVKEAEVFVLNELMDSICQPLLQPCRGGSEVCIDHLVRQLPGNKEQKLSFATRLVNHRSPRSVAEYLSGENQGSITITVERYKIATSRVARFPHRKSVTTEADGAGDDDILTSIVLCNQSEIQPSSMYNFKASRKPASTLGGSYDKILCLHYRTPEVYQRVVQVDKEENSIKEVGDYGFRRCTPPPAPSMTHSSASIPAVAENESLFIPEDNPTTISRDPSVGHTIEVMPERQSSVLEEEVQSENDLPAHHTEEVNVHDSVAPDAPADSAYGSEESDTIIASVEDDQSACDEAEESVEGEKIVRKRARGTNKLLQQQHFHSQESDQQVLDRVDAFMGGWYHKGKRSPAYPEAKRKRSLSRETSAHVKKARILQQGRGTSEHGHKEKVKQLGGGKQKAQLLHQRIMD